MQDPQNLEVYRRAFELAVAVSHAARLLRPRECPGLAAQLHRSACSVPANISEGVGSPSAAVCARHLAVALGSSFETETHLLLAARLGPHVGDVAPLVRELRQIRRMLHALRRYYLAKADRERQNIR
ncbi:MAG: four helix bundle protein [Gemmatimonadetes bacterium]|nr:four helix bundle protein [Gemmatimonadota bacterium]